MRTKLFSLLFAASLFFTSQSLYSLKGQSNPKFKEQMKKLPNINQRFSTLISRKLEELAAKIPLAVTRIGEEKTFQLLSPLILECSDRIDDAQTTAFRNNSFSLKSRLDEILDDLYFYCTRGLEAVKILKSFPADSSPSLAFTPYQKDSLIKLYSDFIHFTASIRKALMHEQREIKKALEKLDEKSSLPVDQNSTIESPYHPITRFQNLIRIYYQLRNERRPKSPTPN